MKLSRKSRLVRFGYALSDFGPPSRTTLCAFFWRTFVFMPLLCLGFVGAVGFIFFQYALHWRVSVPITVVIAVAIVLITRWVESNQAKRIERMYARHRGEVLPPTMRDRIADSVFWQGLKTVKGKVCPLIELTDDKRTAVRG